MIRKLLRFIKKLIITFFLLTILSVIALRFVPVYFTPLMVIRTIEQIKDKKNPRLLHTWVGYDDISDNLKRAVVASEDQPVWCVNSSPLLLPEDSHPTLSNALNATPRHYDDEPLTAHPARKIPVR